MIFSVAHMKLILSRCPAFQVIGVGMKYARYIAVLVFLWIVLDRDIIDLSTVPRSVKKYSDERIATAGPLGSC